MAEERNVKVCYTGPAGAISIAYLGERPSVGAFVDDPACYFLLTPAEAASLEGTAPRNWVSAATAGRLAAEEAAGAAAAAPANPRPRRQPAADQPAGDAPADATPAAPDPAAG